MSSAAAVMLLTLSCLLTMVAAGSGGLSSTGSAHHPYRSVYDMLNKRSDLSLHQLAHGVSDIVTRQGAIMPGQTESSFQHPGKQQYRAGGGGVDANKKLANWHCFFNAVSCFRRRRSDSTGVAPGTQSRDSAREERVSSSVSSTSGVRGGGVRGGVVSSGVSGTSSDSVAPLAWARIWAGRRRLL